MCFFNSWETPVPKSLFEPPYLGGKGPIKQSLSIGQYVSRSRSLKFYMKLVLKGKTLTEPNFSEE